MEQTISLKILVFQILRKWKGILAFAITLALLAGVVTAIDTRSEIFDPKVIAENEEAYQTSLEKYEETKAGYEEDIEKLNESIESKKEYLDESYLMNLDGYDHAVGYLEFYVDSLYSINPTLSAQPTDKISIILKAYDLKIVNGGLYNQIIAEFDPNTTVKYIKEVVKYSYNANTGFISFNITMNSQGEVEEIIQIITDFVEGQFTDINATVANHSISVYQTSVLPNIDDDLITKQEETQASYEKELESLESKEESLAELKAPTPPEAPDNGQIISAALKVFILTGVVCGILAGGTIFVIVLFSNKLENADFIEENYKIFALAVRPIFPKKKNFIDNLIYKMVGNAFQTEEAFCEYLKLSVADRVKEKKTVHITGTVKKEWIAEIYQLVEEKDKITFGGDMTGDSDSLSKVKESDAVILVEKRFSTNINKLNREIKYLEEIGKEILGIVVL